jgi:hypothetical protein
MIESPVLIGKGMVVLLTKRIISEAAK